MPICESVRNLVEEAESIADNLTRMGSLEKIELKHYCTRLITAATQMIVAAQEATEFQDEE